MTKQSKLSTRDLVYVALCASLMAICSWISIPAAVPFTLQTFAVFLVVGVLGGKLGTLSVIVYILIGSIGIPVFSGFKGGLSALAGPTGGYILGFILSALVMWAFEKFLGRKTLFLAISMIIGLILCYLFGTIWFIIVYSSKNGEAISMMSALSMCVFPFIIPDAVKIALALSLTKTLRKVININS